MSEFQPLEENLTPAQKLDVVLGSIRGYACENGLAAADIGAIFDAGLIAKAKEKKAKPRTEELEHGLNRLRNFAIEHGITGDGLVLIFEAGLGPVKQLRPDVFGAAPNQDGDGVERAA